MNMKRKFITPAVVSLLTATMLSACGANYKVTFNDYWKKSLFDSSQQTLTETCEYKVDFEPTSTSNFSVDYENGVYKTTFISETVDQQVRYQFKTEFSVQVQYKVGNETSDWLNDSVYSIVTFQESDKALKPLRSEKHIVSHSPLTISPITLATAYDKYDQTIVTEYNELCDNATTTITNNELSSNKVTTQNFAINHNTYNYLDNETLLFALRCINTDKTTSTKFNVYSPFACAMQKINVNFNTATAKDFTFAINGNPETTKNISYYPASIQLSANTNKGTAKTVWIAKTTDVQNNTYRNAMLRQEIPISFGLGTLTFSLKSINFAN